MYNPFIFYVLTYYIDDITLKTSEFFMHFFSQSKLNLKQRVKYGQYRLILFQERVVSTSSSPPVHRSVFNGPRSRRSHEIPNLTVHTLFTSFYTFLHVNKLLRRASEGYYTHYTHGYLNRCI